MSLSTIIEGNWDELKGKAKQQWGKLSKADLDDIDSYDKLMRQLKKAYPNEDQLKNQVEEFLKQEGFIGLKHQAEELWESALDVKDNIKQTLYRSADQVKDSIQRSARNIKDKSYDVQEDVVEYVKTNPIKSVGFALIAGIILSKILKK